MHDVREFHTQGRAIENDFVNRVLRVGKKHSSEGIYVGCDLKQSEQKEKGNQRGVVCVDAAISDERMLDLQFHDAIELAKLFQECRFWRAPFGFQQTASNTSLNVLDQ